MRDPLRQLVRQILREEAGPYGEYLFGQKRGMPSKRKPEEDTTEEQRLEDDLISHYHGEMGDLAKWIDQLVDLESQGIYSDVLSPPAGARYAYRMMSNLTLEKLTKILGYEPADFEVDEVYEEDAATFTPVPGRDHFSWTTDFGRFQRMLKDWGSFTFRAARGTEFLVFLRAPIEGNTFLMNPGETKKLAGRYAYQSEVISVGPVQCDHIWYIPVSVDRRESKKSFSSFEQFDDTGALKRVSNFVSSHESAAAKKR